MRQTVDTLEARILALTEWQVEYETSHPDAGSNYAHLVAESWGHHNTEDLIKDYIMDNDLLANFKLNPSSMDAWIDANMDTIVDQCLYLFEMEEGHIFSCQSNRQHLILDLYPIDEIECQIDDEEIADIGTPWSRHLALTWLAKNSREICLRYSRQTHWTSILSYQATDACWLAVVAHDTMLDILTEIIDTKD